MHRLVPPEYSEVLLANTCLEEEISLLAASYIIMQWKDEVSKKAITAKNRQINRNSVWESPLSAAPTAF